jgi:hypothetical protein
MFKLKNSYLICELVRLFDKSYVSERSVTIDLVARLAEIKPLGESSDIMARLQRNLPTYFAAANCFQLITAMWATSLNGFRVGEKYLSLKSGHGAKRPVSPSPWRQIRREPSASFRCSRYSSKATKVLLFPTTFAGQLSFSTTT